MSTNPPYPPTAGRENPPALEAKGLTEERQQDARLETSPGAENQWAVASRSNLRCPVPLGW